ncbi:iron uptake porin [Almyronema epifaneia]|uniref:Iron uptake porin n=1 Tax=Almyronema epifaneia S1 TaxID=2991925 RepID=A0ABW6IKN6_9CYAN
MFAKEALGEGVYPPVALRWLLVWGLGLWLSSFSQVAIASETIDAESITDETTAIANDTAAELSQEIETISSISDLNLPAEADSNAAIDLLGFGLEGDLAQVTSVSELSDVSPGDWAYEALRRLVEEYLCLEGYPDSTFRGERALTRYEFAAGLNACLDNIVQVISTGEDADLLGTVQRLQEQFAAELTNLRAEVDGLETRTAFLEASQFSTTTKLRGIVFAHLNTAFADGDIKAEGINVFVPARDPATGDPVVRTIADDPATTFSYLAWINFDTSFSGADLLTLQMAVGSGNASANAFASAGLFNTFGVPFPLQRGGIDNNVPVLRELSYAFPVGDRLQLVIGPRINWYRYFDNNRFTFLVTGANSFNSSGGTQVNAVDRGAGAVALFDITDWLDLRLAYMNESTEFLPTQPPAGDPNRGLFGGTNTLTAQLGVTPFDDLNLRFLYTRTSFQPNAAGLVGGALSEPLYGFADDGQGGALNAAAADTFLFNFDWLVTDWLGLFGRYSYGSTDLYPAAAGIGRGEINAQSIQLGVAFPNLLKQGALATISYLRPFSVLDGRDFLVSGGGNGGIQEELEVTYRYPLNDYMAIVPSFYWIGNANNFSDNPDIYVLNLQTQFFF